MTEQQQLNTTTVNDTTTTTTASTTPAVEENAVNTLMDSLLLEAGELQTMYKQWFRNVQNLAKAMQKEKKMLSRKNEKTLIKNHKSIKKMRKFMESHCVDTEHDHSSGAYTPTHDEISVCFYSKEEYSKSWK